MKPGGLRAGQGKGKSGGAFSKAFGRRPGQGSSGPSKPRRFSDKFGPGSNGPGGVFGQGRKPGSVGPGSARGPWKPGSSPFAGDSSRPGSAEAAGAASEAASSVADAASSAASAASDAAGAAGAAVEAANSYTYDVEIDADVNLDGSGLYPWGAVPAYAYQVAVPTYAAAYGIVPTYFSWYYPPASSASVTYITSGAAGTESTTYSATGETAASGTTGDEPYSQSVTAAMDSLQSNPDASQYMQNGSQFFHQRRYADASDQYRRAIPLDPDNGLPRFSQAHALFALGDYDNASYNIRRGLDLMPDWVASGNNIGALYGNQADFDDHQNALAAHLRTRPDDGEALVVRGYVQFFGGDLEGAEASFRKLAAARPDDPIGPYFLEEIARIQQYVKSR